MTERDCVIIGGGVMGCAIGLRLAQAGQRPSILERAIPGAEASSAAAGILSPHAEAASLGPMRELALASLAMYPALVEELAAAVGIDIGYRVSGVLEVALDPAGAAALPVHGQRLSGDDARRLEPALSPRVTAAQRFPDDAQLEPRLLARALSFAAARAGCEVISGKLVRRVLVEAGRVRGVELGGAPGEREVLACPRVVLAAGSWSSLVEGAGLGEGAVRPARGQLAELDTRPPLLGHVVFGPRGYLVPRADGRVIAGSTTEFVGYHKAVTPAGLGAIFQHAIELCPALGAAPVLSTWSGLRPHTPSGLPFIGEGRVRGLSLATGHYRNGILLAPITAELVVDQILGRRPRFSLEPFAA